VYLSLLAVAEDPGLYDQFNDDFQLIFDKSDLADPDASPVFAALGRSSNSAVRALSQKLAGYAKGAPEDVPSLEEALSSGRPAKETRDEAFGKRETGGVMADEALVAEQGGDARLVKRTLGIRSVRSLGSARTGEEVDEKATAAAEANDAADLGAARASQAPRKQSARASARASVRATGSARGRVSFEQVVPTIDGTLPRVSTGNPGFLLVLTDTSGSMSGSFADTAAKKSEALADVVNQTFDELVGRFRSGDRIKDTMDVAAYSYGSTVRAALGGTLAGKGVIKLPELASGVSRVIDDVDDNGEPFSQPIWVEPAASGNTAMTSGFTQARTALATWRKQRQPTREHLVLAVHVTDGQSTDGDPTQQIRTLANEVAAQNGKLLLTNIHLSSNGTTDAGVVFPTEAEAARFDEFGQRLFKQSSVVPETLRLKLNRMGRDIKPGARMMAFNASVDDLAFLFEAGSSSAIDD
jgi:hypothetical protein